MASSTEEVSAPDLSAESRRNESDHFGVFKDFDFLEYESESVEVSHYWYSQLVSNLKYVPIVLSSCWIFGYHLSPSWEFLFNKIFLYERQFAKIKKFLNIF